MWLVLFTAWLLTSCGQKESVKIVEIEVPGDPIVIDPPDEPGTTWAEMRALFDRNCQGCHRNDPFAQSESAMRESRSEAMIRARQMPPNQNNFSDSDRAAMLNFF
jgi:mono/diheme cytochrome c family protein